MIVAIAVGGGVGFIVCGAYWKDEVVAFVGALILIVTAVIVFLDWYQSSSELEEQRVRDHVGDPHATVWTGSDSVEFLTDDGQACYRHYMERDDTLYLWGGYCRQAVPVGQE